MSPGRTTTLGSLWTVHFVSIIRDGKRRPGHTRPPPPSGILRSVPGDARLACIIDASDVLIILMREGLNSVTRRVQLHPGPFRYPHVFPIFELVELDQIG